MLRYLTKLALCILPVAVALSAVRPARAVQSEPLMLYPQPPAAVESAPAPEIPAAPGAPTPPVAPTADRDSTPDSVLRMTLDEKARAVFDGIDRCRTAGSACLAKPINTSAENRRVLRAFYLQRGFKPVWNAESAEKAAQAVAALTADGLDPAAYLPETVNVDTPEQDLDFSARVLQAIRDVRLGVTYKAFDEADTSFPAKNFDSLGLLQSALTAEGAQALPESAPPPLPEYKALRRALADLRAQRDRGGYTVLPKGKNISEATLKLRLGEGGFAVDESAGAEGLSEALRNAQFAFGLRTTGKLDEPTKKALNRPVQDLITTAVLNLERMRRFPEQYNERLINVNIPEALLETYAEGRLMNSIKVIVGRRERATPALSSNIKAVEFHPYWHVPNSLFFADLLPLYKRDKSLFAKRGIRIYYGSTEINPEDIRWNDYDADHFPYRVRQDPGDDNSLGDIKFTFPNPFAVYLHDTPHRELFSKHHRDLSSGCIRVSDPALLAEFVLEGNRINSRIEDLLNRDRYAYYENKLPVSVRLTYLTARVDSNGNVRFLPDIYNRDAALRTFLAGRKLLADVGAP